MFNSTLSPHSFLFRVLFEGPGSHRVSRYARAVRQAATRQFRLACLSFLFTPATLMPLCFIVRTAVVHIALVRVHESATAHRSRYPPRVSRALERTLKFWYQSQGAENKRSSNS